MKIGNMKKIHCCVLKIVFQISTAFLEHPFCCIFQTSDNRSVSSRLLMGHEGTAGGP